MLMERGSWYFCATLHKVEFPLVSRKLEWRWAFVGFTPTYPLLHSCWIQLYYLGSRYASLASQIATYESLL